MAADETPSRYPYLISVRGGRPVAARKDGSYYVCAYETQLGLWWPRREVRVLEYDPHRDFYREQRQAYLDAHPEAAHHQAAEAVVPPEEEDPPAAAAAASGIEASALWERVAQQPVPRPAPPLEAGPSTSRRLVMGW
jgi:hypothetical protein